MGEIERREFLRLAGAGTGAVVAGGLFHDRLLAGTLPAAGLGLFEDRFGVGREMVQKVLSTALSKGGDFADLFLEYTTANQVVMEDDIIKESDEDVTLGVGIRVLNGQQTGYGYTSDLTLDGMNQAALTAAAIAASRDTRRIMGLEAVKPGKRLYELKGSFAEATLADRIAMVEEAYGAATAHDEKITKVVAMFSDELQYVTIANSEGLLVSDARPQARLYVFATAEEKGSRVTGKGNAGGRVGVGFFKKSGSTPKDVGTEAAREAMVLLGAVDPVPGDQPVVLGNKNSGVVVHEAVGHPFEGDDIWRKLSIMWDKLGTMVANPMVTIYDDATIPQSRGSLNVDDEGTETRKVMLIERGKLTGFLLDRLSARVLGMEPNGHGRRQSFRKMPLPRMNNTVLGPGEHEPDEIIKSVKKGFYADSYQGGMVEDTGKFTFSVNLGYMIENGKLTAPVKNATLIGMNTQILNEIEMIGSDTAFFLGTCGKGGQSAAVTAGTPTFKIREMTVGGRA